MCSVQANQGLLLAGAVAYYALLSIMPLLILMVIALSNVIAHGWRAALERAGINDFRWHDLRHTWASWAVQNGVTIFEVQHLGGWSSSRMVERYAHLSSAHLAAAAKKLDVISYVSATVEVFEETN